MSATNSLACLTKKPISLVGLMGVGKTTIGRRLGLRLNAPFVDADHEIELAAGLSVSEIFDRYGEAYFRDGESRVIARLIDGVPKIIATGGGAFMHEKTRRLLLDNTIVVWIDADIDVIADRVTRREGRPLLKDRDARTVLRELAATRNPIYAQATLRVKSQPVHQEIIVDQIMKALQNVQ